MKPASATSMVSRLVLVLFSLTLALGVHAAEKPAGPPAASTVAVDYTQDPICRMDVDTASPPGGTALHGGRTYYFCHARCRETFVADPERGNAEFAILITDEGCELLTGACPRWELDG